MQCVRCRKNAFALGLLPNPIGSSFAPSAATDSSFFGDVDIHPTGYVTLCFPEMCLEKALRNLSHSHLQLLFLIEKQKKEENIACQ